MAESLTLPLGIATVRWCVVGSRGFRGPAFRAFLTEKLDALALIEPPGLMISEGCRGPDQMAELWGAERGVCAVRHLPKWHEYGRSAGPRRNAEMVRYATRLIAFWDGSSAGTASSIGLAKAKLIPVDIHLWREPGVVALRKDGAERDAAV